MVKELFYSGYCRALDGSRMVEAELEGEELRADCAWPDCPYASGCPIGEKLREAVRENAAVM